GTLTVGVTGAYAFTPAPNYNGPVPVATYTLSDGFGATVSSTLAISITAEDDVFTDEGESETTLEDQPATGNVLNNASAASTGDGTVVVQSFTVAGSPTVYNAGETATIAGVGTLTIGVTGAYAFTPAPNYNGPVPVATYTLSDGFGATVSSTLAISITAGGHV